MNKIHLSLAILISFSLGCLITYISLRQSNPASWDQAYINTRKSRSCKAGELRLEGNVRFEGRLIRIYDSIENNNRTNVYIVVTPQDGYDYSKGLTHEVQYANGLYITHTQQEIFPYAAIHISKELAPKDVNIGDYIVWSGVYGDFFYETGASDSAPNIGMWKCIIDKYN